MNNSRVLVVSMRARKRRTRVISAAIIFAVVMLASCAQPVQVHDVNSIGRFATVGNYPVTQIVYRDNCGQYEVPDDYANCQGFLMHVIGDFDGEGIYGKRLNIVFAEVVQ